MAEFQSVTQSLPLIQVQSVEVEYSPAILDSIPHVPKNRTETESAQKIQRRTINADSPSRRESGIEFLKTSSPSFFLTKRMAARTGQMINYNNPEGARALARKSFLGQDLKVFIGTANLGNKMPPPTAIDDDYVDHSEEGKLSDWIPLDGLISAENFESREQFDIMVLGLQESKYKVTKKRRRSVKKKTSEKSDEGANDDEVVALDHLGLSKSYSDDAMSWCSNVSSTVSSFGDQSEEEYMKDAIEYRKSGRSKDSVEDHGFRNESSLTDEVMVQKKWSKDTVHLYNLITSHCPSYMNVVFYLRGEMKLVVLVHNDLHPFVSNIDVAAQNTGLGGISSNKGGIAACIDVKSTRLTFISAHLAAHEGGTYYQTRCQSMTDILNGARVGSMSHLFDASVGSHHCFVLGDLNFRTSFGNDLKHKEKVQKTKKLIKEQNWTSLNAADELAKALFNRHCLTEFITPPCLFPPSFKIERKVGFSYTDQRTPSYTDRILWKSAIGWEEKVHNEEYNCCPYFRTSDHKPVFGTFSLRTNTQFPSIKCPIKCYVKISNIRCRHLNFIDGDETKFAEGSNCCIRFIVDPVSLLKTQNADYSSQEVISQEFPCRSTLKYGNTIELPENIQLELNMRDMSLFTGSSLYCTVLVKDKVVGTVALGLDNICFPHLDTELRTGKEIGNSFISKRGRHIPKSIKVEESLLKNGRMSGKFKCDITVWWYDDRKLSGLGKSRVGWRYKIQKFFDIFRK